MIRVELVAHAPQELVVADEDRVIVSMKVPLEPYAVAIVEGAYADVERFVVENWDWDEWFIVEDTIRMDY